MPSLFSRATRFLILLLPACLLLLGVSRTDGEARNLLAMGCLFQILIFILSSFTPRGWREGVGPSAIVLYLTALGWLWLVGPHISEDWYPHLVQALLLIVPLFVFAVQTLTHSGAASLRQGRVLAQRLAQRKDWPAELSACRELPEVKAFREALHVDATPALNLLHHPRLAVRLAALAALEFRPSWRKGQVNLVLQVARTAAEPAIRAAAINALANVSDRLLIEALAEFLRDSSWEVRRAVTEALLWDSERRWPWVRNAIRQSLADPAHQQDGPLRPAGQLLTAEAVADLNAWTSEKGILAVRAAQSLGVHYLTALSEQADSSLCLELQRKLADPHTSPVLRLELAGILKTVGNWDKTLLEQLLDPSNPASLRLMAAESLLHEGIHDQALATLHAIARLPNREIALATADVVQRRLGIDLGLPLGQPLPPLHSRQAAEVTRRVMIWAAQQEGAVVTSPQDATSDW
ncbi:MAG TPA: HEAT repeat domain-containing protein [Gemmataceae bacterium]|nr:HEAT repeat domain-containing protein [Gemmataceae bacterium]